MRIINGEQMILGRVASYVAKAALLGEELALVNCEKIVITGARRSILEKQFLLADLKGKPTKGVFYERRPDFFVQKSIKRMLPNSHRGKAAFKKIKCYISTPENLKKDRIEKVKNADAQKLPNLKYITVGEICKLMGARWE